MLTISSATLAALNSGAVHTNTVYVTQQAAVMRAEAYRMLGIRARMVQVAGKGYTHLTRGTCAQRRRLLARA